MSADDDLCHMRHALALGQRGWGNSWPNPAVGCVIVKDNRVIGRGFTQPGGRPHAEVMALAQAGPAAKRATAYVTLEPCCHHGQSPPCADALIAAGIARVVSATTDPDPRVSGQGHARLRQAGVSVTAGVLEAEAQRVHAGFFLRVTSNRPHVTLKLATTLDGRIAVADGTSRWITGPLARRAVHALRAQSDGVMVGIGTALADNPDLTVRDLGVMRQPVRVVLDSGLRLPLKSRLVQTARAVPLWLCHGDVTGPALEQAGARLIPCATKDKSLDLTDVMAELARAGLTRVLCEGGAGIAAGLLQAGLVDEVMLFTAGRVIGCGGKAAVAVIAGHNPLEGLPEFELHDHRRLGDDMFSHWRKRSPA